MQVLYVPSQEDLRDAEAFNWHMEPLLQRLENAALAGHPVARTQLCRDYLQVCRWPFRRLEYSFALQAVATATGLGGRALEAGAGITPFAHALASLGWDVIACDFDRRLMTDLGASNMTDVYGSAVRYEWQDLTALSYPDASFDLVTCVSVVEHIGAPLDNVALAELRRVLKPGGQLVLTLDYEPPFRSGGNERRRFARRLAELSRRRDVRGFVKSTAGKWKAHQMVAAGKMTHARTPNQCFQISHLRDDIMPGLAVGLSPLDVSFAKPLHDVYAEEVPGFWDLVPGLFERQGRRLVLPVAARYIKPS